MNIRNVHDFGFARMQRISAVLTMPLAFAAANTALAQTTAPPVAVISTGKNCDPCVPPAVREQAVHEEARTAVITAKSVPEAAANRLRARFDAADQRKVGRLTRAEAVTGGFGFIDQNFERIDRAGRGEVSFEDLKVFLQTRGAKLD